MNENPPVPLGTLLKSDWKVGAVMWDGHERYYMLTNERGDVSLMPAFVVEAEYREGRL